MPFAQVIAVASGSPGERAGVVVGDEIRSINDSVPRDVIAFSLLSDLSHLDLEIDRGGLSIELAVDKHAGEPLGIEVASAVFDRVRTCDNHCAFCFIYQLPKQMRKSLYVKDDDYRLSFLYGNFTTLTRFTELDLERVVTERLSPLYVSIHATDPDVRAAMLRNRRGATSLRWLSQLLSHGIEVHGQVVVCPGVNDGDILDETLFGILERFSSLSTVALVPLGVSRFSNEETMRPHRRSEARAVLELVARWQEIFTETLGRRLVYAADEYYLLAAKPFPTSSSYDGFDQHENGIGMASAFAESFHAGKTPPSRHRGGFFASVDGAPASGYRARRADDDTAEAGIDRASRERRGVTILSGVYGKRVLDPLVAAAGYGDVEVLAVKNRFFGGNIAVTGLLTGIDVRDALARIDAGRSVLLPDVCLSEGRFLDGMTVADLPRSVEVLETRGDVLRRALDRAFSLPSSTSSRRELATVR